MSPERKLLWDPHRRVNRVLVAELASEVTVIGPEAHHLREVLRLRPGAEVEAFDGRGYLAAGQVTEIDRHGVKLALGPAELSRAEPATSLTVAVALLKGDKLADVVRPCTELGAARFVLFWSQHADVRTISPARLGRLRRVAEEAARQCGRAVVPAVEEPVAVSALNWQGEAVVADPNADEPLTAPLPRLAEGRAVTIITGPEGGLSDAEVAALSARGALAVNLGRSILRAETAPVALAAAVLLTAGRA